MSRARKLGLYLEIFSTMMRNIRVGLKRSLRRPASLGSRHVSGIIITGLYPQALTPGDTVRGENWLAGDYIAGALSLPTHLPSTCRLPIQLAGPLHGFDWLRHLRLVRPAWRNGAAFYVQTDPRNPVRQKLCDRMSLRGG